MKSVLALSALLFSTTLAADWPQFRGPSGTGIAASATIPDDLKIDWTAPLPGRGLASPIVVGGKVFIAASSGPKQERLHVLCFSATDGAKLWERQLKATGRTMAHQKTSVAACTPCSDGTRVFVLWSSNDVAAFDLDGNLQWTRGLTADYPNVSNSLGMASSPAIIGNALVTVVENDSESYTIGLDPATGRNLWKLERPKAANWTSPIPYTGADGTVAALLQSSKGITAVNPANGSTYWEYAEGASTTSSSVVAGGVIFAPSNGITALKPAPGGAPPEQIWRGRQLNPSTISPVVLGTRFFSINSAGVLTTASVADGTAGWKLRLTGPFSGSPVGAGDRLAIVSEKGLLQIVDTAAPEGKLTAQLQLPLDAATKELALCTPAISGKHIFLRTDSAVWRVGAK